MKVLLTGANGFVGSHILQTLRGRDIPAAVFLRPSADRSLIEGSLGGVEVRLGGLADDTDVARAMAGITHVIHCAGATKSIGSEGFREVNERGAARMVSAINRQEGRIARLIHISSLAAAGPALPSRPAREEDPPAPVSDYGRSKLAGEEAVRRGCRSPYVILRPPAVYGPADREFLRLFRAAQRHIRPRPSHQPLSVVYADDLAQAAVACLDHPAAPGRTYYVASPETTTARDFAGEIARQTAAWSVPLPLPTAALWPACCLAEAASRLTGRANVLSLQKYAELRAPGWVCDPSRLRRDLGLECRTGLKEGIARTLRWYRKESWL